MTMSMRAARECWNPERDAPSYTAAARARHKTGDSGVESLRVCALYVARRKVPSPGAPAALRPRPRPGGRGGQG